MSGILNAALCARSRTGGHLQHGERASREGICSTGNVLLEGAHLSLLTPSPGALNSFPSSKPFCPNTREGTTMSRFRQRRRTTSKPRTPFLRVDLLEDRCAPNDPLGAAYAALFGPLFLLDPPGMSRSTRRDRPARGVWRRWGGATRPLSARARSARNPGRFPRRRPNECCYLQLLPQSCPRPV